MASGDSEASYLLFLPPAMAANAMIPMPAPATISHGLIPPPATSPPPVVGVAVASLADGGWTVAVPPPPPLPLPLPPPEL